MIVAMIALFVALSGTAVATTSALITGRQIANNSITGADVKNKSLTAKDFKGSVRGARGAAGPAGPAGPQGAQGAQGVQGPAGAPNPNAADSDKLDGKDSTEFYAAGSKVADSDKLDGVDGANYQRTCLRGSITAFAHISSAAIDTATYENVATSRYTCANNTNTVRAKRTNTGRYTVDFGFDYFGLIQTCPVVATATIAQTGDGSSIRLAAAQEAAGILISGDCVYNVEIFNPDGFINRSFNIVQYDTSGGGLIIFGRREQPNQAK